MGYWEERQAKAQAKLTTKAIKETEEQLRKYYESAMQKIIGQFEQTYNKVLLSKEEGREPTPADLYKLDKYWRLQGELQKELQKLGDKQSALLGKKFVEQYQQIYEATALKDNLFFGEMDKSAAQQMINQIWCADGKSWSQRVWTNTDKLQQALNDDLIDCLIAGKKPSELRKKLMSEFDVSFSRADTVVKTEMAHIQTQAAQQRYKDYGIKEVQVLVDADERTCEICSKLEGEKFPINGKMPVPAHPRCRCCIIPVVDTEEEYEQMRIEEPKKPIQKAVEKPAPVPTPQPAPQNIDLTLQNNNDKIQLDNQQQKAQEKVKELQQQGDLHVYDKNKESHKRHVRELLGVENVDDAAWAAYEQQATELLKKDIDGDKIDGFISEGGWLFKYERETGKFVLLSDKGTISTFFIPDRMTPEEYWKLQIERYKPKE